MIAMFTLLWIQGYIKHIELCTILLHSIYQTFYTHFPPKKAHMASQTSEKSTWLLYEKIN